MTGTTISFKNRHGFTLIYLLQSTDMGDLMNNSGNASSSIPVIQEKVDVGKKIIEKDRIKISKTVKKETEVVHVPVTSEQVHIERVAVNKIIESAPEPVQYEGNTMIIPVLQEVTVIEKKLLLVEEIRITKTSVSSDETKEITLSKEEINIERGDNKDVQNFNE